MNLTDVTPLVLTYNEEANLAHCLGRLRWAHDILVVDSGSTDCSQEIAESFPNARWITRAFDNHTSQWNFGLDLLKTEWALVLDADYVLADTFEDELRVLLPSPEIDAFSAQFRYVIYGKPLRGSLYPPRAVLFRKSRCRYEQDGHTQRLNVPGVCGTLSTPILHQDRKPLTRWLQSQDKYAQLEADKLLAVPPRDLGLQDRLRLALIPAAPLALLYALFVRGAALDGWRGWYYALQRMLAEAILSLRLLERKLGARD